MTISSGVLRFLTAPLAWGGGGLQNLNIPPLFPTNNIDSHFIYIGTVNFLYLVSLTSKL